MFKKLIASLFGRKKHCTVEETILVPGTDTSTEHFVMYGYSEGRFVDVDYPATMGVIPATSDSTDDGAALLQAILSMGGQSAPGEHVSHEFEPVLGYMVYHADISPLSPTWPKPITGGALGFINTEPEPPTLMDIDWP